MSFTIGAESAVLFEDAAAALHARAYRVGYRVLGSGTGAEDIAQECLIRAYSHWKGIAHKAEPWVARVAYNLAVDELRRVTRERRRDALDSSVAGVTPSGAAGVEERIDLMNALSGLPRRQREVVALRYLADQSQEATAALLGLTVSTVARHAAAGLARLRGHLPAIPHVLEED